MTEEYILRYILYSLGYKKEGAHSAWGGGGHVDWKPLADEMTSKLDLKEFQCINLECCVLCEALPI